MNKLKLAKNKGFTLIELAIAIAVIGIIVAMLFNKFGKSFITTAKSESVYSNAQQVAESWKMLTNLCGNSLDPNAATLSKAGSWSVYHTIMLINPEDATYGIDTTKYRRCYAQSGFTGVGSILKHQPGCSWGGWGCIKLEDYYALVGTPSGLKATVHVFIPLDIAEQVWLNYNSAGSTSFTPGASQSAGNMVHYTPDASVGGNIQFDLYF